MLIAGLHIASNQTPHSWAINPDPEKSLVMSMFPSSIQLNPLHTYTSVEAQAYTALYEGLVIADPVTLQPIPGIARSWTVNETQTKYTFLLREEARFSDGQVITAQHFVDTLVAHLTPEGPSPFTGFLDIVIGAREYRMGNNQPEDIGIEAVSDHELVFKLNHPAPYFLALLAHQSMVVIHPADLQLDPYGDHYTPISSGPFALHEFNNEQIVFRPNPYYWDHARIELDEITIELSDDVQSITERFNAGEIQWAKGNFNYSQVNNPSYVLANPLFSTFFFYFNYRQQAYRDPLIRTGISLLIPWDEIRSESSFFNPSDQLIPEVPGYSRVEGLNQKDTERGLELLEQAGYPHGTGLPDITIRIPHGSEQFRLAEIFQASIEDNTAISVHIDQQMPTDSYYQNLRTDEYTIASITWIGDYLDPLTFLMLFISDSGINEAGHASERFDQLIERSHTQSGEERMKTLSMAEQLLLQEGSVWPINHTAAFHLVNTHELEGWFSTALDIHPFKFLRRRQLLPGPGITNLR